MANKENKKGKTRGRELTRGKDGKQTRLKLQEAVGHVPRTKYHVIWCEIWGWEEKRDLEKIMIYYIRWIFNLDFCTPRYIMTKELRIDKLKINWGIRAYRYKRKIKEMAEERWVKVC